MTQEIKDRARRAVRREILTTPQIKALRLAEEHGWVYVAHGFGRVEKDHPNHCVSATWVRLVSLGHLTPYQDGTPFTSEVLSVRGGCAAWLTDKGKAMLSALRSAP